MAGSHSTSVVGRQHFSFAEWMNLQEHDLSEMLQAQATEQNCVDKDVLLRELIEKNVEHFQNYARQRTRLARDHVSPFFSPPWCSCLEGSLLWIAGCRPTLFIRLIYTLSGVEIEAQIRGILEGAGSGSSRPDELSMSSRQLSMINQLHTRTIKREEKLSEEMANLQENIADQPVAGIARESSTTGGFGQSCVLQKDQVDKALDDHSRSMVRMLEEADKLRIATLKELLNILSPVQAMDFLIASKKLHICIHEWGKERDLKHG